MFHLKVHMGNGLWVIFSHASFSKWIPFGVENDRQRRPPTFMLFFEKHPDQPYEKHVDYVGYPQKPPR